nr:cell division protein SepF [bacterium]
MANKDRGLFEKMMNVIGLSEADSGEEYEDEGELFDEYEQEDFYEEEPEPIPVSRSARRREERRRARERDAVAESEDSRAKLVSIPSQSFMKMMLYQPLSYRDTQNIIDNLRNNKPVIVNLENLERDIAQRVLDFLSGAVYALNGRINKVSKGIFVLTPHNVDIGGNMEGVEDNNSSRTFHTIQQGPRGER